MSMMYLQAFVDTNNALGKEQKRWRKKHEKAWFMNNERC
jgi:hypothetical protein